MARSPSPSGSHTSAHSSKRRRYDEDSPRSGHASSRSHHRSSYRDEDDYDSGEHRSRSDRDRERRGDRERRSDDRAYDRDRDRDRHRDRDYRTRDRDYDRSTRDSDRSSRSYHSDRHERSSRHHHDSPRDVDSPRDRERDRARDYDGYHDSKRRHDDDDLDYDRHRSSRRYRDERSPRAHSGRSRSPELASSRDVRRGSLSDGDRRALPLPAATENGRESPLSTNGHGADSPAPGTPSNAEEEKQRQKRERLEAWKKKKAAEAAAAAGSGAASPAPPGSPRSASAATPVAARTSPAPSTIGAKSPAPPSPAGSKAGIAGLPAKPVAALSAALPTKPISLAKPAMKPVATPAASPADATAAAAAAAAAISNRLSSLGSGRANPLSASLPAKPAFSLGSGPLRSSGLKNSLSMGGEDDGDERKPALGMFKIEGDIDMNVDAAGDEKLGSEDEDDEELEGGAAYRADANAMREARMAALRNAEGLDRAEAMQIDEKPTVSAEGGAEEEEEEEDELEAFMKSVQKEVKNVDKADKDKLATRKGQVLLEPTDPGEGEDEVEEENELDKVGVSAQDILALAAKKVKKGRELTAPDHSKIDYLPFRKAFYTAPPEVAELTEEQVKDLRLELDDIKVRGAEPPKPATKWSYFGLPAACIDVIKSLEYAAPTSIQAQAIPAIMSGRDIIGVAKTGSGKTMAFILPMFRHIKDQPPLRPLDGPVAMIMTPTRELATQIYKECKPFLKALGLRASCAYGGMPLKDNIADMKRGSEVIVCTPGRMIELLSTNSGRLINLQRVTYLVLDEADRMFDMGFEPQVMKILGQIRPDRQTVLFSATFPRQMEALARKVLKRPLEITVGGRSVVADTITQVVEVRSEESKFNRLLELLGQLFNDEGDARALIFVERQESADKLFVELKNKNYTCMPLHGGREQIDRDQTIVDFKNGSCPIVIATSVAARGLDVKQLKLVVQYDVPNHMEDYVHRAGRTGRAGNKGTCVTFITPEQDKYAIDVLKALQASNAPVPKELEEMAKAFADKVKAGKAQAASSGFGGKGLERLDEDRDAASRAERAAYGETAEKERKDPETEAEEAEKTAQSVTDLKIEVMRGPAPNLERGKAAPSADSAPAPVDTKAAEEAAKKAEEEAIAAGKSAGAAGAASVLAKFNAMLKAKKAAVKQQQPEDHSTEAARRRDPDATDYHAIVWINDYPQKARWKVTNKETMVHLVDSTGASITNKGIFYEPGKEPGPNDLPKLHLLIESNEEFRVQHAIAEIKKALIEGATMALEAEQRQQAAGGGGAAIGRYSVV